jgi:predicted Mrr-cat superfamily restriction endonuclease
MNSWIHRISHHAETSHPLLERGYLSIGFSDFADQSFLDGIKENGRQFFEDEFRRLWGMRPRTRISLWNFLQEMQEGDRVLVPGSGTFSVYEIRDRALPIGEIDCADLLTWNQEPVARSANGILRNESTGSKIDLGFFRKVALVAKDISRSSYADAALSSRLKIRFTTAKITDLNKSIDRALAAHQQGRPLNLYSELLNSQIPSTLALIKSQLNPDKFEKLIEWYFYKVGATRVHIPAKNEPGKEGDADVVAEFEPIKTIIYVQAKAHTGETSEWAASQIKQYKEQKEADDDDYARLPWVVSSADQFSEDCRRLAKENKVRLFAGEDFVRLLLEAGIGGLEKALQ